MPRRNRKTKHSRKLRIKLSKTIYYNVNHSNRKQFDDGFSRGKLVAVGLYKKGELY